MVGILTSKLVALLDLPDIDYFLSNPANTLAQVLTTSLGGFGFILVYFLFVGLVYDYTKNLFNVAVFSILYGVGMAVLYSVSFQIFIYLIVMLIFANILWRVFFLKKRA